MFARFVIIYCLAVPFVIHSIVVVLSYIDKGADAKIKELTFFIVVAALLLVFMIASSFAFLSVVSGIGFLLGSAYIIFLSLYMFQRFTKDKKEIA
jgi:hypothetical protein